MAPTRDNRDRHLSIAFDSLLSPGSDDLWSQLPRELATLFRPGAEALVDDILHELQRSIPAFAARSGGAFEKSIVEGIKQAILQFNDRLADPHAPRNDRAQLFRELSLHEIQEESILDVLQMAYRIGARVAWRHMARTGERAGVPTTTLCLLAEALFAYIDELSALSIEGHASTRAREAGALERRRKQLLELILSATAPTEAVTRLAEAARWALPDRVIAVALEAGEDRLTQPTPALDQRFLVDLEGNDPCLLIAEAHGHLLERLAIDLAGWRAAIGPTVPLADARESLRWARRIVMLVQRGILPEARLTRFHDHLASLWLLNDPFLVKELADRALAPMAGLTATQRAKLSETLLVWLETRRSAPDIARLLDIHPQTVRYRLRQLERLFGARLDDPDARFDIEIALRAQRSR